MTKTGPLGESLLAILVDPIDKESLYYFADRAVLYNPRTRSVYAIRDGIPVLLANEARELSLDEAQALDATLDLARVTGLG